MQKERRIFAAIFLRRYLYQTTSYQNVISKINIIEFIKYIIFTRPFFSFQMNLITELYKVHRCDYGVKLGLTPLYISILFVSFGVLVYGNCAIKLFQGTKDSGINIGKQLKALYTY